MHGDETVQTTGRPRVEQGQAADLLRMIYRLNTATREKMLVGPKSAKSPLSVDLSRTIVQDPAYGVDSLVFAHGLSCRK